MARVASLSTASARRGRAAASVPRPARLSSRVFLRRLGSRFGRVSVRRLLRVIAIVGVVARLALAAWEDAREPEALATRPALLVTAAALVAVALLLRREA